jgi:hypothetical protein
MIKLAVSELFLGEMEMLLLVSGKIMLCKENYEYMFVCFILLIKSNLNFKN